MSNSEAVPKLATTSNPERATRPDRRRFLAQAVALGAVPLLSGCDALSRTEWFPRLLTRAEDLNLTVHRWLAPRRAMAQEFSPADISPSFRSNGTSNPDTPEYNAMVANGFRDYRLQVSGLIARPAHYSLAQLRAMPSRTQITRHDCVEGWSAIGKWQGVPLHHLLQAAQPDPRARYVVFLCADTLAGATYYESIDMDDAWHAQTLVAYALNDAPLPVANGAPIRMRIERQLGYKMAKYVSEIRLVEHLADFGLGHGGYWPDRGYAWYAGI